MGDSPLLGKMYGFFASFSGEGHEKLRGLVGYAPGETGELSVVVESFGSIISMSRAAAAFCTDILSRRPMTISAMPTIQTAKRYAPRMPPI